MRPTLILQPVHNSSTDIVKCFALGKPLNAEQLNFINRHQKQLSSQGFDPICRYYLDEKTLKSKLRHSFLLPFDELNFESLGQFKRRLQFFLTNNNHHVELKLTPEQLLKFKEVGAPELILYHGNQFLTGAPFFPGGIPPVLYFQWGNLFGVVKYVLIAGEKNLHANTLLYFEAMEKRNLDQCVLDYEHNLKHQQTLQDELLCQHRLDVEENRHFLIKPPQLMPNLNRGF